MKKKRYCIDCGIEIKNRYASRCRKCSGKFNGKRQMGINNPNYKNGKTVLQNHCIDCGDDIHSYSLRCRSCAVKELWTRKEWKENNQRKISNTLSGRKIPDEVKLKISNTLKKLTKEGNHFIPTLSGEEHYNWQGGKSKEEYGIEFTNSLKIKIRESYGICVWCGINQEDLSEKLIVHHINHNKKDNRIENLITMCRSCHIRLHHLENRLQKEYDWNLNSEDCKI